MIRKDVSAIIPKVAAYCLLYPIMSTEFDGFLFDDPEGYETILSYTLGGLCPIQLGSELGSPPRYRVIAKLGYSAYSTVWLARDRVEKSARLPHEFEY